MGSVLSIFSGLIFNVMNIEAKRVELIEWILSLSEDALNKIDAIKEATLSDQIVAYSANGEPLTKELYVNRISEIRSSVKNGAKTFTSTEIRDSVLSKEDI